MKRKMHKTYISSLINYYALSTRSSPLRRRNRIFLHVHSQAQPLLTPQTRHNPGFFVFTSYFLYSFQPKYVSANAVISFCHLTAA